ncbi:MAG: peptidyl-prolyl cis-trans isomerase [Gemmatimonadota bacterium]
MLASCAGERSQPIAPEPGIVARIGPRTVAASELREFVAQMPPPLRSRQVGEGARNEYLRSLMARQVLAMEAEKRGLDTVSTVARRAAALRRRRLVEAYQREALAPAAQVGEDEVRQLFEDLEMGRERQMAAIVVHSQAAAREVVERLRAGETFEALAAEVSANEPSARQGGVLGFITINEARRLNIPDGAFRDLPRGEVGPIVPLGQSFQIIRFVEDRQVPMASRREELERELYGRKRAELEGRRVRALEAEYHWRPDTTGLGLLLDAAWGRRFLRRQDIDPGLAAHALFRHDGGEVCVGDYLDALWGSSPAAAAKGWGTADSASVVQAVESLILGQEMLAEAARRSGIADRPEEQAWLRQVTEELAIQELRRREVVAQARVTDDEASDFYEGNEEAFRRPTESYIVEVLVPTEAEARQVRAAVADGGSLADLAEKLSVREGARQQAGMVIVNEHMRLGHPLLYRAVSAAPLDEVTGPAPVEGGYSVFQVIHREGGEVLPFSEVAPRARALARKERRDDLLGALIASLFEQLGDEVVVYQDELAAALPDSLLPPRDEVAATPAGSP